MKIVSNQIKPRYRSMKAKGGGFSLIEVTISIAITAVALVSLMGMLPAGMRLMREAGDRAVETRIHQQILGEILLVEWENRFKFDYRAGGKKKIRYYDDQGILLERKSKEFDLSHVYTARINVPSTDTGMGSNVLPASLGGEKYQGVLVSLKDNEAAIDPNLQLVIVEITSVLNADFEKEGAPGFDDPKFFKSIRTFQATIAKMGKDF